MLNLKVLNQRGQSLLEFSVLIGVVLAIVAGLSITTISGLRNSQFSQNQTQATKLAQEGLENLRVAQDRNCPIILSGVTYKWYDDANLIWDHAISSPTNIMASISTCVIQESANDNANLPSVFTNTFTRVLTIQDDGTNTNQKKITSKVSWTDASGKHESNLVTIIVNK